MLVPELLQHSHFAQCDFLNGRIIFSLEEFLDGDNLQKKLHKTLGSPKSWWRDCLSLTLVSPVLLFMTGLFIVHQIIKFKEIINKSAVEVRMTELTWPDCLCLHLITTP